MNKVFASLETWKNRLEDTSKRNRAINFKETKLSQIKILSPNIKELFNVFNSKEIEFANLFEAYENVEYDEDEDGFDFTKDTYSLGEIGDFIDEFLQLNQKKKKYLFTNRSSKVQRSALRNIESKARLFLSENAINICYLSLGMVRWREELTSNIFYKAPLLFVPIEITQDNINAPYKIHIDSDELTINSSFLQLLDHQFNIDIDFNFDNDNSLYDNYELYKEILREIITDKEWSFSDDVHIGLFSFSKINMLNDIKKNEDKIMNNKLVQLLAGKHITLPDYEKLTEDRLDFKIVPSQYFRTLDADSSQEMAIEAAISGQSFVLQGPPGTGKSQTITNIISELIARGKKILFVAEKKAALDVVYNNLKKVDLHEFALPIHNKATKPKELVMELHDTLMEGQSRQDYHPSDINMLEASLVNARTNLNDYANALTNFRKPLNKSVYEIYGLYAKYIDVENHLFDIKRVDLIDNSKLAKITDLIDSFKRLYEGISYNVKSNAWYGFNESYLSNTIKEDIDLSLKTINENLDLLNNFFNDNLLTLLKPDAIKIDQLDDIKVLYESLLTLTSNRYELAIFLINNNFYLEETKLQLKNIIKLNEVKKIMLAQESDIRKYYHFEVLSENVVKAEFITRTKNSFFEKLFSKEYRQIKRTFKKYFKGIKRKNNELKNDVLNMLNYNNSKDNFEKLLFDSTLLNNTKFSELSLDLLEDDLIWIVNLYDLIDNTNFTFKNKVLEIMKDILRNDKEFINESYLIKKIILDINDNVQNLQKYFDVDKTNYYKFNLNNFEKRIIRNILSKEDLQDYISFNNIYNEGININIIEFFDYIINNELTSDLENIFMRRYYELLLDYIIMNDSILKDFNKVDYENFKRTFAARDKEMINMAKVRVKSKIRHRYPEVTGINSHNIEISLLKKEANKSRRHLPIRKLIEGMPDLLTTLKPCLMMSPLSVSTYLINSDFKFDIVIFDEASQVTPENAIGAIYRSNQVIIVGDKEQLPPTSFFDNSYESDEDDDMYSDVEDFASILELASGSINSVPLSWHYRSKYEDLIEPSNRHIYKNLITFPSPQDKERRTGVEFIKVDGVYVNTQNQVEAQEVVKLIFEHFDEFKHERSLGIVTFNQSQQRAIENEVDKIRRENPNYEEYFDVNIPEPFFIKNIETVQGDERDTIISSVSYGPTPNGKISMNFGPINKEGGYRRLNVAFTRAKQNLIIVSSITEKDIDLNRSNKRGVIFLKEILRFAEFGHDDKLDELDFEADFDSPFEEDVYNEIINMGFEVDKQVGSSGYKIDLAVKDKNQNYILGIECDGATYHSSKSARNRDRLRQDVLEQRGWNIYRIWSTDWFKNRSTEIKKLDDAIHQFLNGESEDEIDLYIEENELELVEITKIPTNVKFENYPEYQNIKIDTRDSYSKRQGIKKMINELSPIHFDEIKTFIPKFYNRQTFSVVVEREFKNDLSSILHTNSNIKFVNNYLIDTYTPIKFRKNSNNIKRRDFLHIHLHEIKDGFMEIIKIVKKIDRDALYRQIVDLSGYQTISSNFRNHLDKALNDLVKEDFIIVEEDIIQLK